MIGATVKPEIMMLMVAEIIAACKSLASSAFGIVHCEMA